MWIQSTEFCADVLAVLPGSSAARLYACPKPAHPIATKPENERPTTNRAAKVFPNPNRCKRTMGGARKLSMPNHEESAKNGRGMIRRKWTGQCRLRLQSTRRNGSAGVPPLSLGLRIQKSIRGWWARGPSHSPPRIQQYSGMVGVAFLSLCRFFKIGDKGVDAAPELPDPLLAVTLLVSPRRGVMPSPRGRGGGVWRRGRGGGSPWTRRAAGRAWGAVRWRWRWRRRRRSFGRGSVAVAGPG